MPNKQQIDLVLKAIGIIPTPAQEPIIYSQQRQLLVAGGERSGKLLDINTPIPTIAGWKLLKDIVVGDYIFSDNGQPTRVSWVSPVETTEPCYLVEFDTGEKIVAGQSHLWATQSANERRNTNRKKQHRQEVHVEPTPLIQGRKFSVRTTKQLSEETLTLKPKTKWGTGFCANYSTPCALPAQYKKKELVIAPYVLGAWLGDGNSYGASITCDSQDEEILDKILSLGFTLNKYACLAWGIGGLHTKLRQLNLLKNKHIPEQYLQSSVEDRIDLLQGLMDTDGSATPWGCEFYNKNEILISGVQELLASLGVKSWKRRKESKLYGKPCGDAFTLTFSAQFSVFHLARKKNLQNLNASGHTREHYIRSVKPCLSVPVKCLGVEAPSKLFLVGRSFIPTHNSETAANYLTTRLPFGRLYWLVASNYNLTRPEYDYTCRNLEKLGYNFQATKQVDPGQIEVLDNKGRLVFRISTKSSNDPRSLAAEAPDGVVACEGAQLDYESYLRLRGRIAEKRGWLFMSGTFESSLGWFPELWERGQAPPASEDDLVSFSVPSWTNVFVYPGGREDPEIKAMEAEFSADWFNERLGGKPSPPHGRVFVEFSNIVHTGAGETYQFNPIELVYLFVDPGFQSAYAVLAVQKRGEELYIIDEVYEKGLVTSDIIKICKQKPWWNRVIGGVADIAATQHQAMPAVSEIWLKEAGVHLQSQKLSIRDGIEAVKRFLLVNPKTHQSLLHINSKCKGIISEFGGCPSPITNQTAVYRWKMDKEGNVIGENPNDRFNHSVKALSYGIVNLFGFSSATTTIPKIRFF